MAKRERRGRAWVGPIGPMGSRGGGQVPSWDPSGMRPLEPRADPEGPCEYSARSRRGPGSTPRTGYGVQGTRGRDHPGQGRAHGSGVGSTRARVGPIGPKEGKGSKESSMGCIPSHTLKTVASRSLRGALALDSRQSTMELHTVSRVEGEDASWCSSCRPANVLSATRWKGGKAPFVHRHLGSKIDP